MANKKLSFVQKAIYAFNERLCLSFCLFLRLSVSLFADYLSVYLSFLFFRLSVSSYLTLDLSVSLWPVFLHLRIYFSFSSSTFLMSVFVFNLCFNTLFEFLCARISYLSVLTLSFCVYSLYLCLCHSNSPGIFLYCYLKAFCFVPTLKYWIIFFIFSLLFSLIN